MYFKSEKILLLVFLLMLSASGCTTLPQSPIEEFEEAAEEERQRKSYQTQEKYHSRKAKEHAEARDELTAQHHQQQASKARERESRVGDNFIDFLMELFLDGLFDQE
ncbi:MAG TPA: hypothetical protein DCZ03_11135 [Gammaproteobacteria bacterium]|nr:hypothetical protein [Gammaproteobacteria bacterium]